MKVLVSAIFVAFLFSACKSVEKTDPELAEATTPEEEPYPAFEFKPATNDTFNNSLESCENWIYRERRDKFVVSLGDVVTGEKFAEDTLTKVSKVCQSIRELPQGNPEFALLKQVYVDCDRTAMEFYFDSANTIKEYDDRVFVESELRGICLNFKYTVDSMGYTGEKLRDVYIEALNEDDEVVFAWEPAINKDYDELLNRCEKVAEATEDKGTRSGVQRVCQSIRHIGLYPSQRRLAEINDQFEQSMKDLKAKIPNAKNKKELSKLTDGYRKSADKLKSGSY